MDKETEKMMKLLKEKLPKGVEIPYTVFDEDESYETFTIKGKKKILNSNIY